MAIKLFFACDHAGLNLQNNLISFAQSLGYDCEDLNPCSNEENLKETSDYVDAAQAMANALKSAHVEDKGILICGSGIGISMAANRFSHIRAALCHNPVEATLTRQHNNANVLCLGGRLIGPLMAQEIFKAFLMHEFEGGRHQNRVNKLS